MKLSFLTYGKQILKYLIRSSDLISYFIRLTYKKALKTRTWLIYGRNHIAPLDPYETLWIDPEKIKHNSRHVVDVDNEHYCHVLGGDWDLELSDFRDDKSDWYEFLEKRFDKDKKWEELEMYDKILEKIDTKGHYWHSCKSEEDVKKRCKRLDSLFDDIKNSGYLTNKEIWLEKDRTKIKPDDIAVNIGRNGEFIYENSKHRLSIALILELEKIPVRIVVRHEKWQKKRDKIAKLDSNDSIPEGIRNHIDHTDIKNLIDA